MTERSIAIVDRLRRPVDASSLAAVRIAFGVLMVVAMLRYFAHGWIETMFLTPTFFFDYEGFGWIRPWPGVGMYIHFGVLTVLAAGIALGWRSRACAVLFGLGFTWAHLVDKTNYLNHYHLISLLAFLIAALPAHATMAVDTWRHPDRRVHVVSAWAVWAVRAQLGLVYVFGGVGKLNADWLLRAQPLRMWLAASTDVPVVGPLLAEPWVAMAASVGSTVFDLGIVALLLWPTTRLLAYGLVVAFHVGTALLFPIGIFPWLMMGLTPVFFAPDWPRQLAARLRGRVALAGSVSSVSGPVGARWPLVPLAACLAIQIAVPLRGWADPVHVHWTESGFRFAWRVMVMEKNGTIRFRVHDVADGRSWWVDPRRELTPLQYKMMATQPDMILAYGRHLGAQARAAGHADVEVRAESFVSLNGHPSQRYVRADVDLLDVDASAPWMSWLVAPGESGADRRVSVHSARRSG